MNSIKTNFIALSIILSLGHFGQSLLAMEREIMKEKKSDNEQLETECSICFEEMKPDNSANISVLACGHSFCNECIKRWGKDSCPTCRQIIVKTRIPYSTIWAAIKLEKKLAELKQARITCNNLNEQISNMSHEADKIHEDHCVQIVQLKNQNVKMQSNTLNKLNIAEENRNNALLESEQLKAKLEQEKNAENALYKFMNELNQKYEDKSRECEKLIQDMLKLELQNDALNKQLLG